ncbi:MAG TPA: flagellar biosynthetic protein FliO [Kofleriaceae bacterium]|nr:flagellar biosynthetic protein FliO [Kofleriaceae bacterium]
MQESAGGGYGALMLTSLLVLVLVCVVAWVALRLVARWLEGRRAGGGVTVVARVPLEPRRALYVVEAGGRRLLIGSSEGGVSLVTELAAEASVDELAATERPPRPRSFAELFALAMNRRRERKAA